MREHFPALEADLLREYQLDVRTALWGEGAYHPVTNPTGYMGVRRLASLVYGLPLDSTLAREMNPEHVQWQRSQPDLLAMLVETVDAYGKHFSNAKATPVSIPRPGDRPEPVELKGDDEDKLAMFSVLTADGWG